MNQKPSSIFTPSSSSSSALKTQQLDSVNLLCENVDTNDNCDSLSNIFGNGDKNFTTSTPQKYPHILAFGSPVDNNTESVGCTQQLIKSLAQSWTGPRDKKSLNKSTEKTDYKDRFADFLAQHNLPHTKLSNNIVTTNSSNEQKSEDKPEETSV